MAEEGSVELVVRDRVATVTLRRPEIRNALADADMLGALVSALTLVGESTEVSALVLTGKGSAFSAGGNVKDMREGTGLFAGDSADEIAERYRRGIQRLPRLLAGMDAVTIAAVNGPAMGAGCDLALMCDLRYASTEARFGEVFANLGLVSGDGGTWFLVRAVGRQRATELLATGRIVDAAEAKEIGLILDVFDPDSLLEEVQAVAAQIAAKPPHAVRLGKRLVRHSADPDLDRFLDLSASYQAASQDTADHREAVEAFFERRSGSYVGR